MERTKTGYHAHWLYLDTQLTIIVRPRYMNEKTLDTSKKITGPTDQWMGGGGGGGGSTGPQDILLVMDQQNGGNFKPYKASSFWHSTFRFHGIGPDNNG